ncbi:MAG: EscR/YscR/HrcR family type III secretion system export apparatus protein [Anaeromyxobacter sp.]
MSPELAGPIAGRPVELLVLLGVLAVAPAALVALTSFLKISVVLSIARSALGAPQVPPNTAVTGLALVLSALVMGPVLERTVEAARPLPGEHGVDGALAALARGAGPLRGFLARHARPDDRAAFVDVARRLAASGGAGDGPRREAGGAGGPADDDLAVLAPAFVVSELRRAFVLGFLVFVPFLAVDLVVSNVLLALGLTQLSPSSVALPFKLLLFVAVDGWKLLARALALSYAG